MSDATTGAVGWLRAVVVDARDPQRLSEFWRAVLDVGVVETAPDWIQLAPSTGGTFLAFEPTTTDPPRGFATRIDIEVVDMDVARDRIEALGGTMVEVIHARPGESHYRMADPEGNEFTVVLPMPVEQARAAYGDRGAPRA